MTTANTVRLSLFGWVLLASSQNGMAATYTNDVTVFSNITMVTGSYVSFAWAGGELLAGPLSEGGPVASLTATVLQGTASQRPAVRWTDPFYRQTEVSGCPSCRDIGSDGGGTLRLKLGCDDAKGDLTNGGWLTATSGSAMHCALTAGQTAPVVAGVYTVSLEGSVYSP